MRSREILEVMEGIIMDEIGYHLAECAGRLELYNFAFQITQLFGRERPEAWRDACLRLIEAILRTKPFCMRPPDTGHFAESDTSDGRLLRVLRVYDTIRDRPVISVCFYGNVLHPPRD